MDEEYGKMLEEDRKDIDEIGAEAYDKFIGAEVVMDLGDQGPKRATVKQCARDRDDNLIGCAHKNPLLDTREYEIDFEDGTTDRYLDNVISENLYSQVDSEGRSHLVFQEIIDHRSNPKLAVSKQFGYTIGRNGNKVAKKTTRGWELLVCWKDGRCDWIPLKELKEGNPVEVAEYAINNGIDDKPAFAWWVPITIRKRNRIISKLKSRYWMTTHKFGIRVPKSVEEALQIDQATGTDFWCKAIEKEMTKVKVAFEKEKRWMPEQA
jgi:hypothetical protein